MKLLLSVALVCLSAQANAMTFSISGDTIEASGEIVEGDAERLKAFAEPYSLGGLDSPRFTLSLTSRGGNLLEGIRLGEAIRSIGLPTRVRAGHVCASACAISYLGGKAVGVTSDAVWRELEPGAVLGFHSFYTGAQKISLINETLGQVRIINALIAEYASRMGNVDPGLLGSLLNTPPERIEVIDTPREIEGLGIRLVGEPPRPPRGWALTACRDTVAKMLNPLDPFRINGRLIGEAEPMANLAAFRERLLNDKFPESGDYIAIPFRRALQGLHPSVAIDLIAGQPLYVDRPEVGVWRVRVDRGAGFYYDACYAITDFTSIWTVIVDGVSHASIVKAGSTLQGFPPDRPLW